MGKRPLRVGLIGFGTIGVPFARAVRSGQAGRCTLTAVLVRGRSLEQAQAEVDPGCLVTSDPEPFFAAETDLVIECAGQEAVRTYGERVLASGRDLMVLSAGALAKDEMREHLVAVAEEHGSRILVPSGAIVCLDGIGAAAVGEVEEVTHVTRKPPRAWKGTPAEQVTDLDALTEPLVLFTGSPRQSAALYPANVNVQAAVALAGIGLDRTRVQVVADPTVTMNTHELRVRGAVGEIQVLLQNVPSPGNPKTGIITAHAVIKAVRNMTASLVVGV